MQQAGGGRERACIAVDLGAESCRVSLLRRHDGALEMTMVHRFANGPQRRDDGSLRWPLNQILEGVAHGIRLCAELAPEGIESIAVDGWAVDYVRVDAHGQPQDDPYCYRDARNAAAAEQLHARIPDSRLRSIAGVQIQPLNTLYQLYADQLDGRFTSCRWVTLPEFLLSWLGGRQAAEYTNATHTGMIDLATRNWSDEIASAAGIPLSQCPEIVAAGTKLGELRGELARLPGLEHAKLIAPACHDTASAVAGIAATGDDWAYISSGTWSLVGTVLDAPRNNPAVWKDNFTNLGGIGGSICFHKNVNGMWLVRRCMDHWASLGHEWNIEELMSLAAREPEPECLLQVDEAELLQMEDMPARIHAQVRARGAEPPSCESCDAPAMVALILHSLAARYAEVLKGVERHTGRHLRRICVVGGGSRNNVLNELTARATGLKVEAHMPESSTVGNFAVQLAVLQCGNASAGFRAEVAAWATRLAECANMSARAG